MAGSKNMLYTEDNLYVMNGMNSDSVDLIYTDPPFNSKRVYSAPTGSKAAGAMFKDTWTWQDVDEACLEPLYSTYPYLVSYIDSIQFAHGRAMASYLAFMAQRLVEMRRILKDTGSFYLHCDPTASHYLKIVCDMIFGRNNFVNEIIWSYRTGGTSQRTYGRKHDVILFYAREQAAYKFNPQKEKAYTKAKGRKAGLVDYGAGTAMFYEDDKGVYNEVNMRDVWEISYINSQSKERTGYPTQKPLELLYRIIKASSDKNDIVFDPFCGCATACVAAQRLHRKWIGIDIEAKARQLLMERLEDDTGLFTDFVHTNIVPARTDIKPVKLDKKSTKQKMFDGQEGKCNGCRLQFEIKNLTIDHVLPRTKGGQDNIENLQLLCGNCNSTKGNRNMDYLNAKLTAIRHETRYNSFTSE